MTEVVDVVVVGSGAGGLATAIVAAHHGLSVVVLEKEGWFGGSSAVSGGAVWLPNTAAAAAAGTADSEAEALAYLRHEAGNRGDPAMLAAFVRAAPLACEFLARHTHLQLVPRGYSPDYHPDAPGAKLGGRAMDAAPLDGRSLGAWFTRLRPPIPDFTILGGLALDRGDIGHFMNLARRPASAWHAAKRVAAYALDRARGHRRSTRLVMGAAVVGRLMRTLLDRGVVPRLETPVTALLTDAEGRVTGVETPAGRILARRGVVLATGGFPRDAALRARLMPHVAEGVPHASMSPAGNTGDGIRLAEAVGGRLLTHNGNAAFWTPVSRIPNGDGTSRPFPHLFLDRAKPGVIAVDRGGRRFANEALSYHDFVQAMLEAHRARPTIPAVLICDHRALRRYGLGPVPPFPGRIGPHLASGYLKRGATPSALATALGLPPAELEATIARFNASAAHGEDPEFGKGGTAYQTYLGDAALRPNPCVAPLATPPFYGIEIEPGDIGTSAGLATDASARVLDGAGAPIPGLLAVGNDMNSVMAGAYPGAGITLGPALAFGWIAGMTLADAAAVPQGARAMTGAP